MSDELVRQLRGYSKSEGWAVFDETADRIESLSRECEELRKDAGRWQKFKQEMSSEARRFSFCRFLNFPPDYATGLFLDMDAAIDGASGSVVACSEHEKLRKDAQRYRWLRDVKCNHYHLTRDDDHATNYTTAKEWIEECAPEEFQGVAPDELQKMKDTNTIWCMHIYPDTPIGSYTFYAATLDAAIDAAKETK